MRNRVSLERPTPQERKAASKSYPLLEKSLENMMVKEPEIEIQETGHSIVVPRRALVLLSKILEAMSKGQPMALVPSNTEMTTQSAAEFLGCSRPHLVKLLETGKIPFTKVGKHRRILFEDLLTYSQNQDTEREKRLIQMMKDDGELGLYEE